MTTPNDPNAIQLYNEGLRNAKAGRLHEAIPLLERSIEADPSRVDGYNVLGKVLFQIGQTRKARRCWKTALELDPANTTGIPMPAKGGLNPDLTDTDLAQIVAYMRTFAPRVGPAAAQPSQADPAPQTAAEDEALDPSRRPPIRRWSCNDVAALPPAHPPPVASATMASTNVRLRLPPATKVAVITSPE